PGHTWSTSPIRENPDAAPTRSVSVYPTAIRPPEFCRAATSSCTIPARSDIHRTRPSSRLQTAVSTPTVRTTPGQRGLIVCGNLPPVKRGVSGSSASSLLPVADDTKAGVKLRPVLRARSEAGSEQRPARHQEEIQDERGGADDDRAVEEGDEWKTPREDAGG